MTTLTRPPQRNTETSTVRAILQYLALKKIPAWRMNSGAFRGEYKGKPRFHRFGVAGMADIIGLAPMCMVLSCDEGVATCSQPHHLLGRFLAIEVKSATGKPTPEQTAFLAAVVRAGGLAFIARSVKDVQDHGL